MTSETQPSLLLLLAALLPCLLVVGFILSTVTHWQNCSVACSTLCDGSTSIRQCSVPVAQLGPSGQHASRPQPVDAVLT